jgi:ATP-binding cassette, subfamily B, bacterial
MIFTPQKDQMDCGPACLCMIAGFYGKKYSLQYLRDNSFITREGVSLLGIQDAANKIGFEVLSGKLTLEKLNEMPLPCILHWNQNHFVVLEAIKKNRLTGEKKYKIADPGHGFIALKEEKFERSWLSDDDS